MTHTAQCQMDFCPCCMGRYDHINHTAGEFLQDVNFSGMVQGAEIKSTKISSNLLPYMYFNFTRNIETCITSYHACPKI